MTDALAEGAVTVEQAVVIAQVLGQVADLPLGEACEREQAAVLLIEAAATLIPRQLARAGAEIVEHLTRTPSVDDPAEEAALAREQRLAARKPTPPSATARPGGTGPAPGAVAGPPWTPGRSRTP